jgi:hypothetical protein
VRIDLPVLTTARLVIRPWATDDLDAALQLFDVELRRNPLPTPHWLQVVGVLEQA